MTQSTGQTHKQFVVFLVDDDPGVARALSRLLQTAGYKTRAYASPKTFLDEHDPTIPGCIVVDLLMPGLDGLSVQQLLAQQEIDRPVVFLTGQGSIAASVSAMKAGAIDFLVKPVKKAELFDAISRAEERERCVDAKRRAIRALLRSLTPREAEVMAQMLAGRRTREIAANLGIVEKTVKVHRGRVMEKMGVRHMAKLVRMVDKVSLQAN